ncbi:hypothetical protein HDV05_007158 [Chytridiales sp. JEL 0842]|nr:hypothetical protein HDV05_007158 [Chytridiales sp. JEL 0842]
MVQLASLLAIVVSSTLTSAQSLYEGPQVITARDVTFAASAQGAAFISSASVSGLQRSAEINFKNYGGPVIPNVDVYTIYWTSGASYKEHMHVFYDSLVKSAAMDAFAEYNTTRQTIGKGKVLAFRVENDPDVTAKPNLDDNGDIRPYLRKLVRQGVITPSPNLYIPIHLPPGYTYTYRGLQSCIDFCSMHSTIELPVTAPYRAIHYAVIPDPTTNPCSKTCHNAHSDFQSLCTSSSHALWGAITNPQVGLANSYAEPLGWYHPIWKEVSDACAGEEGNMDAAAYGVSLNITVRKIWSNKAQACVLGAPPAEPVPLRPFRPNSPVQPNPNTVGVTVLATRTVTFTAPAVTVSTSVCKPTTTTAPGGGRPGGFNGDSGVQQAPLTVVERTRASMAPAVTKLVGADGLDC